MYIGDVDSAIRQYPDNPLGSGTTVWIVDLMNLTEQQSRVLVETFQIGEDRLSICAFDDLSPSQQLLIKTKVLTWDEIPADVMVPKDLRDIHKAARVLQTEMAEQASAHLNRQQSSAVEFSLPTAPQAASGRGNPKTAIAAYHDSIEWADSPAAVVVKNEEPVVVRDDGLYTDVLRALIDSKNPDEKYRHYAMYKSGMSYTDIAKSENPDWETQYGREQAIKLWATEADKIRKQVQSVEKILAKRRQG